MPLISVIIPNYNRTTLLERAIKSVVNQKYSNYEIIVVDDASEIDPQPTINKFSTPPIRFIRNTTKTNAAAGRNKGAKAAKGEYIALLDSDDEWLPNHLIRRVELTQKTNAKGIYGAANLIKNKEIQFTSKVHRVKQNESMINYLFSGSLKACTPSLFIERDAFLKVLFNEKLYQHQDYDFNIRFHKKFGYECDETATVNVYVEHEDRMGKKPNHESCSWFINKYGNNLNFKKLYVYIISKLNDLIQRNADQEYINIYLAVLNRNLSKASLPFKFRTFILSKFNLERGIKLLAYELYLKKRFKSLLF